MGELDELAGAAEGDEIDDLGVHLRALMGKSATPAMKSAFKAAVHLCMDEYGPEAEEEEPPSVTSGAVGSGY